MRMIEVRVRVLRVASAIVLAITIPSHDDVRSQNKRSRNVLWVKPGILNFGGW